MKIGTYNVLACTGFPPEEAAKELVGADSPERIEHFARVFEELNCDVLALQEGGVSADTIQAIARRMGVYLATIPSPKKWPGQLLSRYPILESRVFSHPIPEDETPPLSRCAGAVRLKLPDRNLWVFLLHLHPHDVEMRVREAQIVEGYVDQLAHDGTDRIVLGDFNCAVEERVHQGLMKRGFVNAMATVGGGLQPTMRTFRTDPITIDHIYVSPSLKDSLVDAAVVTSQGFHHEGPKAPGVWVHSDHLPVVATLAL